MNISDKLDRVPHYQRFYGVDSLFSHARDVARTHPDLTRVTDIGSSKAGESIPMVSVGSGDTSILLFASPHPNEPIGAMLAHFLLDELMVDESLRTGRTWHIIPCIDPDGTRLNEGWFDGPFTLKNYCRNFYRPKGSDQAEWTFPIEYKTFRFDSPIPETQALMKAITTTRPDVMYALHNAGFGGAYYYISWPLEAAYETLHKLPTDRDLPLSLGEPEMPFCTEFHPAIYKTTSVRDAYDYYEKYGEGDPADQMFGGASSKDFAAEVSDPFCLVTEVPYFTTEKTRDETTIEKSRGQVILEGLEESEKLLEYARGVIEKTDHMVSEGLILKDAAMSFIPLLLDHMPGTRKWAESDDSMRSPATVAQRYDAKEIKLFYNALIVSMYRRAMELELAERENPVLREYYEAFDNKLDSLMDHLGEVLDYSTVPIRDLVQVQYGALLAILDALGR